MNTSLIFKDVLTHYRSAQNEVGEEYVLATVLYGSQNYNMSTSESDVDTKTFILPSIKDMVLDNPKINKELILPDGSINTLKDYRLMMDTFIKGNINFLEILFSNFYYVNENYSRLFFELVDNKDLIANCCPKNVIHAARGMAMQKYVAFNKQFESKKEILEKYGYDPKQLHHLVRLMCFIIDYGENCDFAHALVPKDSVKEQLISLKIDPLPYKEALDLRERTISIIKDISQKAIDKLPCENNLDKVKEFYEEFKIKAFNEVLNKVGIE